MDFDRLPSFLLSLILHLGLFALVLFWPVAASPLPDFAAAPMVTGLVTIKPGQSVPGKSLDKPRDARAEATAKPVEKAAPKQPEAKAPAKVEKPEQPEVKPTPKPVEKPPPAPEAVPIPKEPEKPTPKPKPEKALEKKPENDKVVEKQPQKKEDDLARALASLDKEVKRDEKRQRGKQRDAVTGALDELKKQPGGPGEGGPGMGSGGSGDGVGALGSYIESVISRVKPNWSYVEPANRRNFTAVVNIRIDPDGTIREARIVQPSGNSYFDGTVMNAIRVTARLEPPDSPEMMDLNIAFSPDSLRGR
ncbi:TonB family protein [Desulfovibrio sp. OttesenSCG-928-F20]|nr:TonB family protein [Desulfovibrio sp. OttesenSCG-928-F20]